MKTAAFILSLCFTLSFYLLRAQEQIIRFTPEVGDEYVFEKTDLSYSELPDGGRVTHNIRTRVFKIEVEKVVPGEEVILGVTHLKNFQERPFKNRRLKNTTDYFFPGFHEKELFNDIGPDYIEPLLCMFKIQFSLNLKTKEIKVFDRIGLLEKYHRRLVEQGYSDTEMDEIIQLINETQLKERTDLVSFFLWFHDCQFQPGKEFTGNLPDERFIARDLKGNFVEFGDEETGNLITGKTYKKYRIDTGKGIITDYSTIRKDSSSSDIDKYYYRSPRNFKESTLKLVSSGKIKPEKLLVSGRVEKPLSNKIFISFLDAPFGEEMKKVTAYIDEKGSFSAEFDFRHGGLIYVENENRNRHKLSANYVFYAEPGDTIGFEAKGDSLPWDLEYVGNRIEEAKLLQEIKSKIKYTDDDNPMSRYNRILDIIGRFGNRGFMIDRNNRLELDGNPEILGTSLIESEAIISRYKDRIDPAAYDFILKETKACIYEGIYGILISFESLNNDDTPIANLPSINIIRQDLKTLVDTIDIGNTFNDYGLHSRSCISTFLTYNLFTIRKIEMLRTFSNLPSTIVDLEQDIQLKRLLISGSPLYRIIADQTSSLATFSDQNAYSRTIFLPERVTYYLRLLLQNCNDKEIVAKIRNLLNQIQINESGNFVPEITFLDIQSKAVSFGDFAGNKPTVVYLSTDWGGERYIYDEYAKDNHDVNFVMITEGTSFREWKEYNEAAEPVARHLFFNNDSITFKEMFLKPDYYLVFDKNGNFLGSDVQMKSAYKKAKASLDPQKKEIDKSTLRIIILILGILLFTLFSTLLVWKWHVKQRFKKESQVRRLRELELTAIRSQMNPHFLFNSLNSVQNLVQQNKGREAHLYLSDFAGLIRKVLQNSEKEEISLAEELEMVGQYLNLEKLRFDFDFTISVGDGIDVQNSMVPSMLLQPFAENAVIHGLQNKPADRKLSIETAKTDEGLKITIEDNGIGREAARQIKAEKNGKGIKMNTERLDLLSEKHGEKYGLKIFDLEHGTKVVIFIPEEK